MSNELIQDIATTTVLPANDEYYERGGATRGSSKVLANQIPLWVSNVAALAALDVTGISEVCFVFVLGQTSIGDGGQNPFYYNSSSTATPDGFTVIAPGSGSGRWIRANVQTPHALGLGTSDAPTFAGAALGYLQLGLLELIPETGYAGSGTIALAFGDKTLAVIGLSGNATFTTGGLAVGNTVLLAVNNTTNSPITLAWPAGWLVTDSVLPTSLGAHASLFAVLVSTSTADSGVYASCTSPTPIFTGITAGSLKLLPESGYATAGTITLDFSAKTLAVIHLTGNANFGNSNLTAGAQIELLITNTTGGILDLTWPAWIPSDAAIPLHIQPGASYALTMISTGTTAGAVYARVANGFWSVPAFNGLLVNGIVQFQLLKIPPNTGYATGGAIELRFDIATNIPISLTTNATFTAAGWGAGLIIILTLSNVSGSTRSLTWSGAWAWCASPPPATLANGGTYQIILLSTTGLDSGVVANFTQPGTGSSGTVTSVATSGRGASGGPITSAGTLHFFDPNCFNIADYGAIPNSSGAAGANTTAINAAMAAAIANGGGTIYFPGLGVWYISSAITVSTAVNMAFLGDSASSSMICQVTANTGVFAITETSAFIGIEISKLRVFHNSATANSSASAILVTTSLSGSTSASVQSFICTDVAVNEEGGSTTFAKNLELSGLANVTLTRIIAVHSTSIVGVGVYIGCNAAAGIACIGVSLQNCVLAGFAIGVQSFTVGTGAGQEQQSTDLFATTITGCTIGLQMDKIVNFIVNGCDLACGQNIVATGSHGTSDQGQVTGNLFYSLTNATDCITGPFTGTAIVGNTFAMTTNNNGVHLTTLSAGNTIVGNVFGFGGSGTGVLIDSGATLTTMNSSAFLGTFSNMYVNNGGVSNLIGTATP